MELNPFVRWKRCLGARVSWAGSSHVARELPRQGCGSRSEPCAATDPLTGSGFARKVVSARCALPPLSWFCRAGGGAEAASWSLPRCSLCAYRQLRKEASLRRVLSFFRLKCIHGFWEELSGIFLLRRTTGSLQRRSFAAFGARFGGHV